LTRLLADPRPAVAERAIGLLSRQGDVALPSLNRTLVHKDAAVRQNALWTLARIATPQAAGAIRLLGLADRDPGALTVAIQAAGACRDRAAVGELCDLLSDASQ